MPNSMTMWNKVDKAGDTMTGGLAMAGNKITGLAAASVAGDAAQFEQLESQIHQRVSLAGDTMIGGLTTQALSATTGSFSDDVTVATGKLVDGRDISAMVRAKILIGTYTGNGADNRNIDIGIDLTAKQNVRVDVWKISASTVTPVARTEHGQGDGSWDYYDGGEAANRIQAFTTNGFQVGSDSTVNATDATYGYSVWYEEP
jgi:hypothetical protein